MPLLLKIMAGGIALQKYIGRQLKTARLNKKLTQEQIAEAVGLWAERYGCIERGEVSTTVAVLTRLRSRCWNLKCP